MDHQLFTDYAAHLLFQEQQPMSSAAIPEVISFPWGPFTACVSSWNLKRLAKKTSSPEDLRETFCQRVSFKPSGLSHCLKDPNSSLVNIHCFLGLPEAFQLSKGYKYNLLYLICEFCSLIVSSALLVIYFFRNHLMESSAQWCLTLYSLLSPRSSSLLGDDPLWGDRLFVRDCRTPLRKYANEASLSKCWNEPSGALQAKVYLGTSMMHI